MTEDILDMMAKAKKAGKKKKTAKKKDDDIIRIPPQKPEVAVNLQPKMSKEDAEDYKLVKDTLEEFGLESNIPIRHKYWDACNRIRGRRAK